MDLACLDVVGADDSHAAAQAGFVEVCCVFVLEVEDEELRHDAVDVDVLTDAFY